VAGFQGGGGVGVSTQVTGLSYTAATAYGAKFDGSTDDTTAIQNAINATPSGGTLTFPLGTAKITSALVISTSITIQGSGVHCLNGSLSVNFNTINLPCVAPYLSGTVLRQDTAATDVIQITGAGVSVKLNNFGMTFATANLFTNTGHGVNVNPPSYSGVQDNGVFNAHWWDLVVFGHDGNHYAYSLINPICSQFDHLQFYGGGGMLIENNGQLSPAASYGNMQVNSLYGQLFQNGTAHGIYLQATSGFSGLTVMVRPQVTSSDMTAVFGTTTAPTSSQLTFKADATCRWITLVGQDLETNVSSPTQWPAANFTADPQGLVNSPASTPPSWVPSANFRAANWGGLQPWSALARKNIYVDALAWFDADQIFGQADNTTLEYWGDSSGNQNNAAQTSAGSRPTYYKTTAGGLINGLPGLTFAGAQFYTVAYNTQGGPTTLTQPMTIFCVAKPSSTSGNPIIYDATTVSEVALGIVTSGATWFGYAGATLGGGTADTNAHVFTLLVNSTQSSLRVDGAVIQSGSAGTNTMNGMVIGAGYSLTRAFSGIIGEIVVIPYACSTAQIQAVEEGLQNKWLYSAP
jgi:Pectate lyase superfamily protein